MAEYIDREIAKGSLRMNQHRFTCADEANGFGSVRWSEDVIYAEAAQKAIDSIPSADVAEVVRCKDCRHRDPEDHKCDCGQLERAGCVFPVNDDYFCAYGERGGGT